MVVKSFSFVSSGAARRDDPADRAADRAGDRDLAAFEKAEDLIPGFAMAIRSPNERVVIENGFHIGKVDAVIIQVARALARIPIKVPDVFEYVRQVFHRCRCSNPRRQL